MNRQTIFELISDALPYVGLPKAPIQNDVLEVAIGIVNFEGQMIWDRWPYDNEKAETSVPVDGVGVATFGPEVDAIRAIKTTKVVSDPTDTTLLKSITVSGFTNDAEEDNGEYLYDGVDEDHGYPLFRMSNNQTISLVTIIIGQEPVTYWGLVGRSYDGYIPKTPNQYPYATGWPDFDDYGAPVLSFDNSLVDTDGNVVTQYDTEGIPVFFKDEVSEYLNGTKVSSCKYQYIANTSDGYRRIQLNKELANTTISALVLNHFVQYSEDDIKTRYFPIDRATTALKGEVIDGLREFMGMERTNKGEKAYNIGVAREEKQQQKMIRLVPRHPTFTMDD